MMSQPGQTITINILPNILRSKGNRARKFNQLIRYNNRNIFQKKIMQKNRQEDQFQFFGKCFI